MMSLNIGSLVGRMINGDLRDWQIYLNKWLNIFDKLCLCFFFINLFMNNIIRIFMIRSKSFKSVNSRWFKDKCRSI